MQFSGKTVLMYSGGYVTRVDVSNHSLLTELLKFKVRPVLISGGMFQRKTIPQILQQEA